jgi:hypothetical protein
MDGGNTIFEIFSLIGKHINCFSLLFALLSSPYSQELINRAGDSVSAAASSRKRIILSGSFTHIRLTVAAAKCSSQVSFYCSIIT